MDKSKSKVLKEESAISIKKAESKNIKTKSSSKVWLWILIIGIVGLLVLGAATIKFPYTGMVTVTKTVPDVTTKDVWENVPKTETKCESVNMLYGVEYTGIMDDCIQQECDQHEQYCVNKNFWGNCVQYAERCVHTKCVKYRKSCGLTIENKERQAATFRLQLNKYNYDTRDDNLVKTASLYVGALSKNTIYWDFTYLSTESVSCNYNLIETPMMQNCKDVIVQEPVKKTITVPTTKQVQEEQATVKYHTIFEALGWV